MIPTQTFRNIALLRLVMAILSWSLLPLMVGVFHLPLPNRMVHGLFLLYLTLALIGLWQAIRPTDHNTIGRFTLYLLIDCFLVGLLLAYTGGIRNPMTAYFFLLLALAAFFLSQKWSWFFWSVIFAIYSALALLPTPASHDMSHGAHEYQLHLMGMWFSFAVTSGLLCYFLTRALETLRKNNKEISQIREKILRDDLTIMMGALAATTAHEMATPLSTMAVVLSDLKKEQWAEPMQTDIELLHQQVQTCKKAIQLMTERAKDYQENGQRQMTVKELINAIEQDMLLMKPQTRISIHINEVVYSQCFLGDPSLAKSILHFIDNALIASVQSVILKVELDQRWIKITIEDDGYGFDEDILKKWGRAFNSTKKIGLGVGVFLSHVMIERLGGFVRIDQSPTQIHVFLPLEMKNV